MTPPSLAKPYTLQIQASKSLETRVVGWNRVVLGDGLVVDALPDVSHGHGRRLVADASEPGTARVPKTRQTRIPRATLRARRRVGTDARFPPVATSSVPPCGPKTRS